MAPVDWIVVAGCFCAAWRPFLWVVYRLCPIPKEARVPHEDEPRIPLDQVLGVWLSECRHNLWGPRQHVHPAWEVYRAWAMERAWLVIPRYAVEREERLARYLEKVRAYEAPADNVTKIGVRIAGARGGH